MKQTPGQHEAKTLEYDAIIDGLYVGTNLCCKVHFDEKLLKEGITADISLEEERVDGAKGVEMYIWIPVKDKTAPTQDQMNFGVSVLEKLVVMKKKVYVHCKNGHGRAPTLVGAYLVKKGKSSQEAEAFLKQRRPSVHLEEVQRQAIHEFSHRIHE